MSEKIINICKDCNSIVETELVDIPEEFYELFKKTINKTKLEIEDLEKYADELCRKSFKFLIGSSKSMFYHQIRRIINGKQDIIKQCSKDMEYTNYYECPVCGYINLIAKNG